MVGHTVLREVVGADLLGPFAAAHLRQPRGSKLRVLLRTRLLEQTRPQDAHRLLAVLELRLLVLHRDHDPRRLVGDAHRRVGRVDGLAARTGGAVDVDLQVARVDGDVDVLGLRQHGHGGRGSVDAALRFRLRHALYAMRAALVLEDRIRAVALDRERVVALADRELLDLEPAPLGVAREHPEEIGGKEPRLIAAGSGPDLDDHILVIGRVGFDHREPDLLDELTETLLGRLQQLPELRVVAVLGQQLAGAGRVVRGTPVLNGQIVPLLHPAVLAADLGITLAVVDDRRVGHLLLQLGETALYLRDEVIDQATTSMPILSSSDAALGFSTASTDSSAAIATASCVRSGSRVVSFCSCMPGHMRIRAQRLVRCMPMSLISSNASPATIGMPTMRETISSHQSGRPSGANTKIATIMTISRKLVPQRGWRRENCFAFSGVRSSPAS